MSSTALQDTSNNSPCLLVKLSSLSSLDLDVAAESSGQDHLQGQVGVPAGKAKTINTVLNLSDNIC